MFDRFSFPAADEPGHASVRKLIEAIKAKTETEGLLNLLDEIPQTEKSYFMLTNDEGLVLLYLCQHYFTKSAACCVRLSYCRKKSYERFFSGFQWLSKQVILTYFLD